MLWFWIYDTCEDHSNIVNNKTKTKFKFSFVRFVTDDGGGNCRNMSLKLKIKSFCSNCLKVYFFLDLSVTLKHDVHHLSSPDHLKKPLEDYVAKLGKVRILRTTKREGLIRARLMGAKAAKAQVLTFLDAHCEANVNWLEPLLDRIRQDRTIVAVPVIDIISSSDFSYSGTPAEVIGGFSWDMQFNWHSLPFNVRNERKDLSGPIR